MTQERAGKMTPEDSAGGEPARTSGAAQPAGASGPVPDLRTALLIVVGVILLGWALRAMAVVAVPLVASILIALAVMPVRDWIRERVPSWLGWLGILASMALILLVILLFFAGLWLAAQRLVAELPGRPAEVAEALEGSAAEGDGPSLAEGAVAGAVEGQDGAAVETAGEAGQRRTSLWGSRLDDLMSELPDSVEGILRALGDRAAGAASGVAVTILNSALSIVAGLVVIFFLTLLILAESGDWRSKVRTIAAPRTGWRLNESADVIAGKVRSYLLTQATLGAVSATLYFLWLTYWGVDLRIVWMMLIFLMNFIPNIGSIVGGTLPVIYTLLTQGLGHALGVGAGILVIEQVMGNLVGPRFQSRSIALSPLVILVAILVWGWIWGIAGALLAVPVTTALVVLGSHVPALRPWALLLTDRTTMRGLDEVTRPE